MDVQVILLMDKTSKCFVCYFCLWVRYFREVCRKYSRDKCGSINSIYLLNVQHHLHMSASVTLMILCLAYVREKYECLLLNGCILETKHWICSCFYCMSPSYSLFITGSNCISISTACLSSLGVPDMFYTCAIAFPEFLYYTKIVFYVTSHCAHWGLFCWLRSSSVFVGWIHNGDVIFLHAVVVQAAVS